MNFPGPIQRNSHQKMIVRQKLRPLVVDHITVGLNGVVNGDLLMVQLLLQLYHAPEKRKSRTGGLTALECNGTLAVCVFQHTGEDCTQHFFTHQPITGHRAVFCSSA